MKKIVKKILGFILFLLFLYLVGLTHYLMQIFIPEMILWSWKTIVILVLIGTFVVCILYAIMYGMRKIASCFNPHWIVKAIGVTACAIAFLSSAIQLWSFVDALYFSGFWEYVFGVILTYFILLPYLLFAGVIL